LLSQISDQIEVRLDGIMVGLEGKVAAAKAKYNALQKDLKNAQDDNIQKLKSYR